MTTDWLDPGTWETIAKTTATSISALAKLRDALMRRKKATRKLHEDVATVRKDLEQLVDVMMKHVTSHGNFMDSLLRLLKVLKERDVVGRANQYATLVTQVADTAMRLQVLVLAHENRLKALEQVWATKLVGAKKQRRKSQRRATRRK